MVLPPIDSGSESNESEEKIFTNLGNVILDDNANLENDVRVEDECYLNDDITNCDQRFIEEVIYIFIFSLSFVYFPELSFGKSDYIS